MIRASAATIVLAWREAWANRVSFWWSIVVMILNDLVWVFFWVVVSQEAGDLRGWNTRELLLLQAVLTMSGGVSLGLLGSSRRIGELVSTGGLDSILALPAAALPQVLLRKVEPINFGDAVFGLGLFVALGQLTPSRVVLAVVAVCCSVIVITSFLVLLGCLSFFSKRTEASDAGFHAITLFSAYPIDIFGGSMKVFLHVLVPAAFVTAVPVEILTEFSWESLATLVAFAIGIGLAATALFSLGLRRYTSGSGWVTA